MVAAASGSTVAAIRRPGARVVSGVQHFAAGVVIAALVGEVMPDLREQGHLRSAVGGFASGVTLLLILAAMGRKLEARTATSAGSAKASRAWVALLPLGLLVTVGIDLLLDGLLVGLGVAIGSKTGIILTIALTLEILFLTVSVAGELADRGLSARRAVAICTGLGLATAVGAVGGAALLGQAGGSILAAGLAFGAAALLYLAVEELLVEAHEEAETPLLSAMFFLGFLIIYVLGELGG
ncbi:hypothetical protein [Kribbella sp.]|uniref:hypothetical protein n=1 Tax=Kribbella sp. TaxID=1871183 RepID=UPI002D7670DE|nr:hypothetical protein [Kribbella sp.]